MAGLIWTRRSETPSGSLVIHCPACRAQDVSAEGYTISEQLLLGAIIPLMPVSRSHWLTCPNCGASLLVDVPVGDLKSLPPERVAAHVRHRVSPITKLLAVLAIVLFFWPALGLVMGIIATAVTWRTPGWARKLSRVALVLAVLTHIGLGVLYLLVPPDRR